MCLARALAYSTGWALGDSSPLAPYPPCIYVHWKRSAVWELDPQRVHPVTLSCHSLMPRLCFGQRLSLEKLRKNGLRGLTEVKSLLLVVLSSCPVLAFIVWARTGVLVTISCHSLMPPLCFGQRMSLGKLRKNGLRGLTEVKSLLLVVLSSCPLSFILWDATPHVDNNLWELSYSLLLV